MINWYYVQGTERVGPVNEEALRDLFQKKIIGIESYVWKKGFTNWILLKDVAELNFTDNLESLAIKESEVVPLVEKSLCFSWETIGEEQEVFFIKTGKDRKQKLQTNLYGPYSLSEIKEALEAKCMNYHTLIFAAGMPGWVELGQTPLNPKNLTMNKESVAEDAPLFITWNDEHHSLVGLVLESEAIQCTLRGKGAFKKGETISGAVYSHEKILKNSINLEILNYDRNEQKIFCQINEMSNDVKNIMKNYAN